LRPQSDAGELDTAKSRLRAAMTAQRRALSRDDRASAGATVARIACALPEFERANRVAAYVALDDEMPWLLGLAATAPEDA